MILYAIRHKATGRLKRNGVGYRSSVYVDGRIAPIVYTTLGIAQSALKNSGLVYDDHEIVKFELTETEDGS